MSILRHRRPRRLAAAFPGRAAASALAVGVAVLALQLVACGGSEPAQPAADRPSPSTGPASGSPRPATVHAVATIPPLAWFVARIGGERVAVSTLIPPGASPHAFEPAPRQVAALETADLVVEVGHPDFTFERRYLEPLAERREDVELVRFSAGLELARGGAMRSVDPHLWVAPLHARPAAAAIAEALIRLDPAGETGYRQRLREVEAEIDAVDAHLSRRLRGVPRLTFVVQHPSWGHLANQYGLRQVSIEEEGKEPSPQHLVELIRRLRREDVPVIFVQPGVAAAAAETVAAEVGARVVPLDPLAGDWAANLRQVADRLHEALGGTDLGGGAADEAGDEAAGGTPDGTAGDARAAAAESP